MNATRSKSNSEEKMLVDTLRLQELLCAGRPVAVKIGTDAKACVRVGRRVFWSVDKIRKYLDSVSE